ncbi:MAG: zinc-ribbon domain-containing protein [Candidatus Heimdallarchaeota archaeon]
MRYCLSCGAKLPAESRFCPDCGREISQSFSSTTRDSDSIQPAQFPSRYMGRRPLYIRPAGITLITVLVGLGAVLNFQDGISGVSFNIWLALFSIGMAVFQVLVAYGLWYMKAWGGIAAILLYIVNILVSGFMALLVPDALIITRFIGSIVTGSIIIYYVNSKRDLFTN